MMNAAPTRQALAATFPRKHPFVHLGNQTLRDSNPPIMNEKWPSGSILSRETCAVKWGAMSQGSMQGEDTSMVLQSHSRGHLTQTEGQEASSCRKGYMSSCVMGRELTE